MARGAASKRIKIDHLQISSSIFGDQRTVPLPPCRQNGNCGKQRKPRGYETDCSPIISFCNKVSVVPPVITVHCLYGTTRGNIQLLRTRGCHGQYSAPRFTSEFLGDDESTKEVKGVAIRMEFVARFRLGSVNCAQKTRWRQALDHHILLLRPRAGVGCHRDALVANIALN